ncbi:MAG: ATPase, partial [Candidatus Woesearchaeota archaeon]
MPVHKIKKWNNVQKALNKMLNFLSGDKWNFYFRKNTYKFRKNTIDEDKNIINKMEDKSFDGISLLSGGLDSFSGA